MCRGRGICCVMEIRLNATVTASYKFKEILRKSCVVIHLFLSTYIRFLTGARIRARNSLLPPTHLSIKVGSHGPVLVQLSLKFFVFDWKSWRSHNRIFPSSYYFGDELLRDTTILVLRIYAHFTAAFSSSSGHHFVKIFRRIERGKIKNWRLFSNWMCSIFIQCTKNVGNLLKIGVHKSNCCLKSGLKNNWTKKLEMM